MNQQPVAINAAIGGVLATGVALAALLWPDRLDPATQVAIIAFGNSVIVVAVILLTKSQVTPIANPTLPQGAVVNVQGSEDKVEIQPTPPGPEGIEGTVTTTSAGPTVHGEFP